MTANLLVSESKGFSQKAKLILERVANVTWADFDRTSLLDRIHTTDVLWVRLRHNIDEEILSSAPTLRLLVSPTTGLNHIDMGLVQKKGIEVVSLRGETEFLRDVRATAEHTIGLILGLMRKLPAATTHVTDGGWDRDQFKGAELRHKRVGIVGFGRLGRIVANYLSAFGCDVVASDPNVAEEEVQNCNATPMSLPRLLGSSDIVSLHVDLNPKTVGFFGKREFSQMKEGAWFINTARGELIEEAALLASLQERRVAGAALDVLADESSLGMGTNALVQYARTHGNLIITPHIGGCTGDSMRMTEEFLAEKVAKLLAS